MSAARPRVCCTRNASSTRATVAEIEAEAKRTVSGLLTRHKLEVTADTAEMLANAIKKCRVPPRSTKQTATKLPRRKRMQRARKHVRKLLEYVQRKPSHANSIPTQVKRLQEALNDAEVWIWLVLATPRIDVHAVLQQLETRGLDGAGLDALDRALKNCLSSEDTRTGRPAGKCATVVNGGCIAWCRARRKLSCTWNESEGRTTGPLASFMIDLLRECGIKMTDAALYSALRVAVRYVKSNPNLRSSAAALPAKTSDFPP